MRKASSAARHLVWSTALAGILLLPILSTGLPSWKISFLSDFPSLEKKTQETEFMDLSYDAETAGLLNSRRENSFLTDKGSDQKANQKISAGPLPLNGIIGKEPRGQQGANNDRSGMILPTAFWLLGVVILSGRLLIGKLVVRKLLGKSEQVTDPSWLKLAGHLADRFQIKRRVLLLKNSRIEMPMTWGFIHPKILLPANADQWSAKQRRFVLMHELAHVKRLDSSTQFLSQLAVIVHWFNPFIWFGYRRFLKEREHACDDFVLRECSQASEYAGHLLNIARSLTSVRFISNATVAMARKKQLEGRLLAILNPDMKRRTLTRFSGLMVGAAVLAIVLPVAALRTLSDQNTMAEAHPVESSEPQSEHTSKTESIPGTEQTKQEKERISLVVKSLAEALNDSDEEVRLQAARALGNLENKEAVPALISALKEKSWEMRLGVVEALESIKDKDSVNPLIAVLKDPDWHVRLGAVEALSAIEDARAVLPLCEVLNDEAWQVRKEAAWALGHIGDARAVKGLTAALKNNHHEVRLQAVESLGDIEDTAAVMPLISALTDESWEIRRSAAEALGDIADNRSVLPLNEILNDKAWQVRKEAAWALGEIGDAKAVDALVAAGKDNHQQVRVMVISALEEIGDSNAVMFLCEALSDENWEVRRQAARALGEIGDPRAVEPLTAALKDKHEEVRRTAARALGEIQWQEKATP